MVRLKATILGLFIIAWAAKAEEVPLPRSVASMGDSITAGMFANFKRQEMIFPWVQTHFEIEMAAFFATKDVGVLERRRLSWSTGIDRSNQVTSHVSRILDLNGRRRFPIFEAAVSGNDSSNLQDQLNQILTWSRANLSQSAPDYVTILIGPNDICADSAAQMTDTQIFKDRVAAVAESLLSTSASTRILISALPNIENLRSVAKDAILTGVGATARCKDLWKLSKLCPTLTTISDPNERLIIAQRVVDYNQALQKIVEEKLNSYGDRIRFAPEPYNISFTANDLSLDCFHPNVYGQELISESTWKSSWWAK